MPIYPYHCDNCNFYQTYYLHMGARNTKIKCPKCGKQLKKFIGNGSCFNLKGEGFFRKGIQ